MGAALNVENPEHQPVLLQAVLDALDPRDDASLVDATFGRGGHSRALLQRLGPDGQLVAVDRDPEAIAEANRLAATDQRVRVVHSGFEHLQSALESYSLVGSVDGLLLDLGVSSPQLDDAGRGFSFMRDGALDMRMDPSRGDTAAEWVARATSREIATVIRRLGEEPMATRIARVIVEAREQAPIISTRQLADLIEKAVPAKIQRGSRIHPATRSFQAIRMHINQELEQIESVVGQLVDILAPGGRVAIISFHSLEDRIIKRALRAAAQPAPPPTPALPAPAPTMRLLGRAQRPTLAEIHENPRARSAILRCAERLES